MVKLVNGQQHIVKGIIAHFLGSVTQRGMSTDQHLGFAAQKELLESSFLILLILNVSQVEIRRYFPVGKEPAIHQVGVLKRAAYALFWYSYHHLLDALVY